MSYKIVVISDSHGSWRTLEQILRREYPFDALVHCGDGVDDLRHFDLPKELRVIKVAGNVDCSRGYIFERQILEELFGKRILVNHGDLLHVEHDLSPLIAEGHMHAADIVCFGHTHIKQYHEGYPVLFNPGPADKGLYGVIEIDANMSFKHRML